MQQPVAVFIGLRYMRGGASDRFGRFVSWLSTLGITLGVMALVTVLSVMNGFEEELEKNILGLMPQAIVTSQQGVINPQQFPPGDFSALSGVTRVAALTTADVVLQSPSGVAVGVMLGVDPQQGDPLSSYLREAKLQDLQPGQYQVIMGEMLAKELGLKKGDKLRVMVPSVSQLTPMGQIPSQRIFNVIGTFNSNGDVDQYQMLVNLQDASRLMRYPLGDITGWRVFMDDPLAIDSLVGHPLPQGLIWKDWRERKGELFQAVKMEKNMMGLLLSLIIAVAAFNIITSLSLLVMDKKGEVAILQTQGLNTNQIMTIFMVQGVSAGILGSILGSLLGIILASQINFLFPGLGEMLAGGTLPVSIDLLEVLIIAFVAILLALLATLYPSWCAATVNPAEALRYE